MEVDQGGAHSDRASRASKGSARQSPTPMRDRIGLRAMAATRCLSWSRSGRSGTPSAPGVRVWPEPVQASLGGRWPSGDAFDLFQSHRAASCVHHIGPALGPALTASNSRQRAAAFPAIATPRARGNCPVHARPPGSVCQ
jgi:hypothetical protein